MFGKQCPRPTVGAEVGGCAWDCSAAVMVLPIMKPDAAGGRRILALEPYYGGSHRRFLDGWRAGSRHRWTLLTLPAHSWKWRMRHSAITFAGRIEELLAGTPEPPWDVILCSDMMPLAELYGLAPGLRGLPAVAYFHENQLTYPVRRQEERDLHFGLTNLTAALAARQVWFNSAYHRDSFFGALRELLRRMPDHPPLAEVEALAAAAKVEPPGIEGLPPRTERRPGPLRLLWAARWEFDKNPEAFFEAVEALEGKLEGTGVDFRLSVLGESFREVPEVFGRAERRFRHRIDRWGYLESREEYEEALQEADVYVSTADHEFFGIAAAEAAAAGALPLLPHRLAYPELLQDLSEDQRRRCLYDGTVEGLARKLEDLALAAPGRKEPLAPPSMAGAMERYRWRQRRPALDEALASVCGEGG